MALLNRSVKSTIYKLILSLKFHYGAIKPIYKSSEDDSRPKLTFHYSAINPHNYSPLKYKLIALTFHYSAINPR